jgi:hypothetical protein
MGRGQRWPERVIFIAGASWSGSTMIGCVLGASDSNDILHIGEAHAFFTITRPKYGNPAKARERTAIWDHINYRAGPENAYSEIVAVTGASVIVDSSKDLRWLKTQLDVCKRTGVPITILVTFREFDAFLWSGERRYQDPELGLKKIYYYDRFLRHSLVSDWRAINTRRFALTPIENTKRLCDAVNIPYFSGKERYWEFPLLHLYGSSSQRKGPFEYRSSPETPHPQRSLVDESNLRPLEAILTERCLLRTDSL